MSMIKQVGSRQVYHSPRGGDALLAELRNYCSKLGLYFVDGSVQFCFEDEDFQWVQSCCVNNIDVYYFVWWLAYVALHANWLHRWC